MTLDLARLTGDLNKMSETLAQLDQARRTQLEIAQERFVKYATALDEINAKVQLTRDKNLHWRGAYPAGSDPLDSRIPCPEMPPQATIIANDGSQVPIDRHAAALYYALNIGYIVYPYGADQQPQVGTEPSLHYHNDDLFYDSRYLIPNEAVNARRTVRELKNLAGLAEEHGKSGAPVVILSDGPLLWVQPGDMPQERQGSLENYLQNLTRIRATQVALGGYVDRPGSRGVMELLHLANLEADEITKESLARSDLVGLLDARLFEQHLKPGERSALFIRQSPINQEYARREHETYHCYVNISADPMKPQLARLEMPSWVASDAARRDLLHAVVWQQCQVVGGYPYVLARAHELALISTEERSDLEEMVMGALRRRGVDARPSEKARQKALTGGGRRRHRL
jgi:hypothetical protein